ncbi:hypothetical protein CapIbe_011625 [Capra ibex]
MFGFLLWGAIGASDAWRSPWPGHMTSPVTTDVSLDTAESLPPGASLLVEKDWLLKQGLWFGQALGGRGGVCQCCWSVAPSEKQGSKAGAPELRGPNVLVG